MQTFFPNKLRVPQLLHFNPYLDNGEGASFKSDIVTFSCPSELLIPKKGKGNEMTNLLL